MTRVLMPHSTPRSRSISSSQNGDELLAVDRRLLVGEDEEADAGGRLHQRLDLVDDLLRVAHAVVAPELPLAAEAAGERAAARQVGDGDAHAQRDVDVLVPLQHAPVGRRCASRSLTVGAAGVATTLPSSRKAMPRISRASRGQRAVVDRPHSSTEDLLALAAHDGVDPRRFGQHLRVHEGRVDAAEHGDARSGFTLLGDLQQRFGLVDRRRDRGGSRRRRAHSRRISSRNCSSSDVVRHRVDEA